MLCLLLTPVFVELQLYRNTTVHIMRIVAALEETPNTVVESAAEDGGTEGS